MYLDWIDWGIVISILVVMISGVILSKTHMKSVVDFLSAGRTAGRYLVSVAQGIAGLGAITIIANFEMNYVAGFALAWWGLSMGVVVLAIAVSGFVAYRFRQTRCMTMPQFFEMRYSKNFRIFTGMLAFISGIINFGIFPAVGARFFIYFCGFPNHFSLGGVEISTFVVVMITLLSISLYFVFSGGQIAVIITDFIQGLFVNFVFVIVVFLFFSTFSFDHVYEALQTAPVNASMINPFNTSAAKDFNIWYHLIAVFGVIYVVLSWQGTQAYNSSAKSAHEAKMGGVLSGWRGFPQTLLFLFIPICAYTVMHHADFSAQATAVNNVLATIDDTVLQNQLKVPLVMKEFLPRGLMGAFTAVMLAAFISTHDSYLHSWGSIFIQDVLLPLRKKSLTPEQHIRYLRLAIIGVAIFIFFFSLLFQQQEYILMFLAVTGAIFAGGSGSVIIGGIYWKRGTTAAAWVAMITGSTIAVAGIIIPNYYPGFLNGQIFWFIAMVGAITMYILVSLLSKRQVFDMDKLLHRGKYLIGDEYKVIEQEPSRGLKMLGIGKEFTRSDKVIYIVTYSWTLSWTAVFIIGTIYALLFGIPEIAWMKFWWYYVGLFLLVSLIVSIWFTIGGIRDLRSMLARLKTMKRDYNDDGQIK